jgi:hypothetical protein
MADETIVLFIDTNGFLQVRDLKDLPWTEVFVGAKHIDIMVAPRVIEELDRHKTSTINADEIGRDRHYSLLKERLWKRASR